MTAPAREETTVEREAVARFSRWRGLLSLALPWVLPPTIVLLNEQISYMSVPWACSRQATAALHIVPLVCLIAIALCGLTALRDWRLAGGGTEDEAATVLTRSRFLAMLGLASSLFSALVVIAMWVPMFIVQPCLKS
jgi:hypothetical protein